MWFINIYIQWAFWSIGLTVELVWLEGPTTLVFLKLYRKCEKTQKKLK